MSIQVLGISGSPVPNSNTDWAVRKILKYTGLEWRFVKLSDYDVQPCQACFGCVEGNECVVRDDGRDLAYLFHQAQAFVIGGYTPYNSLDSRTKAFMERMFCLRHGEQTNRGKIGVAVITTACPPAMTELPPGAEIAARQIDAWMREEGMIDLGAMILLGNIGSIRSGHGDDCSMNGIKLLATPRDARGPIEVHTSLHEPKLDEVARELGEKLRQAILAIGAPERREAV